MMMDTDKDHLIQEGSVDRRWSILSEIVRHLQSDEMNEREGGTESGSSLSAGKGSRRSGVAGLEGIPSSSVLWRHTKMNRRRGIGPLQMRMEMSWAILISSRIGMTRGLNRSPARGNRGEGL